MRLSDHLEGRYVKTELQSRTKEEAIRELAGLLKDSPDMLDFDLYLKDVFEREKQASTGIGRSAAIPHARTKAVKDFVVAVGRAAEGIEFSSIDGHPVRIIVLMGTPKDKVKTYLKLLAHLSHLVKTNGFLDALLEAPGTAEVVELFRSHEH
jgi:mannitol/fructose-specific phosphotransferase system IIA component (Ntr-type)